MDEKTEEKLIKLVDGAVSKAVKAERQRVLDGLKSYKAELADDEAIDPGQRRVINATLTKVNEIVRAK